ncbi:MAG: LTA synthase family protein [Eubacteriales bacterium]|nr:LTA synthase family protein [Eubacteriales bacterium]
MEIKKLMIWEKICNSIAGDKNSDGKIRKGLLALKLAVVAFLLFMMWYLCHNFMDYQKNATNQVNKYRVDQVCLLSDGNVITQKFIAKHTHLKTVKLYFSNDYSGVAEGKLILDVVDMETGKSVSQVKKKVKNLLNNDYTEFDTDVQLQKGHKYYLQIYTIGAQSGKEPIVYQWSTKEKGFQGKMSVGRETQRKYLVAKFYYPVTIYQQWLGIGIVLSLVILLVLFPIPIPRKGKSVLGYLLFYLSPPFTFWFVERFTDNSAFRISAAEGWLNILVYYLFFGILYLLFVSRKASVTIGMVFWYVIGLTNYYVLSFKGAPIVPSDIMSASTAASVAQNYDYAIQPVFVWNLLFMILYLSVLWRCPMEKKTGWKKRVLMGVVIVAASAVLGSFVIEERTLRSFGIKNNVWDQKKGYAKNGFFFGFVLNMNSLVQEKPSDYSVEAAEDIAARYEEEFANDVEKKKGRLETKDGTKPNVIAIMNEAFSDLSVIGDFETNQDYMPFIHSLKKDTIKGSLYMSIFGSGTCNSEFEFLTGNSMAFLQNGIIAYTQVVKDRLPNMTYLLKGQGYGGNLALHPYLATGWNRIEVYKNMGFEKFYSESDFTNPLMYRKYISDQSDVEKIIELYEGRETKNKPFYLFNVTMQNHGGFNKVYDNFTNEIEIVDNHKNEQAEQYLSLVKKTDEAFQYLVDYFSRVKEPTILVMFGDHQPAVTSKFYESLFGKSSGEMSAEELMKKYQTPFIIWANYDIKETTIEKMSANYLSAYVMREAGLKTSPYQKFLLKLYEKLPVLTAMGAYDAEGNYYESAKETPHQDMVKEYQILQYNNLIDTEHTVESFFYLKGKKKEE